MKKTVIIILAILPIFLLIIISFAGKILSLYSYISVENVIYIDEHEDKLDDDFIVEIDKGETYQALIKVLPELATDKTVTYVSDNLDVCTVDENGLILGTGHGFAQVNVITTDSNKIDTLIVSVTDYKVSGVELNYESMELIVGETRKITAQIIPNTAINKNVSWTSSDSNVVKVDSNGYITALSVGEVEVFVITEEGTFTDICYVKCVDGVPPLSIDFSSNDNISVQGQGFITTQNNIDLKEYIIFDETKVNYDDIVIEIESGVEYASISEDRILTISSSGKIIRVTAYVGNEEDPKYVTKFLLILM